jgi:hypothetical protein
MNYWNIIHITVRDSVNTPTNYGNHAVTVREFCKSTSKLYDIHAVTANYGKKAVMMTNSFYRSKNYSTNAVTVTDCLFTLTKYHFYAVTVTYAVNKPTNYT